jgi:LPPG:FO 2-phospho-L-lactate transferase
MAAQGLPCSVAGVAQAYEDFLDILICDTRDARAAETLRRNGLRVQCSQTVMRTAEDKAALAREVLSCVSSTPLPESEPKDHANAFRRLDSQP